MDIRLQLSLFILTAILAFFLGRRTSPGGRAVHRLQKELDSRRLELAHYQHQMKHFMLDMQGELERVSGAYRELQKKVHDGNERLVLGAALDYPPAEPQEKRRQVPMLPACPVDVAEQPLEAPRDYSPIRGTLSSRQGAYA